MTLGGLSNIVADQNMVDRNFTDPISEAELSEAIQDAIDDLAADGEIVDTGRRRFSNRTGRYEIVWTLAPDRRKSG
jgi:hypothetical protein